MPNKLSQFWQELKRRNVVRVITVYAGAAFVILELVDMVREPFELPNWSFKLVVIILIVGLIIAVILSWIYDVHPEGGLVKTEPAHNVKEEEKSVGSNSWKIASYISFVVIVGLIVLNVIPRTGKEKISEDAETSIAVLPFENMSDDASYSYIGGAFTDEIIMELQKIKAFDRVLSRTSTLQFEESTLTIPEISEILDVNYIVEGSIQRDGDRLRVRVQVIRGNNEGHIWADEYDGVWEDIFSIQDQIASSVARELQSVLSDQESAILGTIPTDNSTAYDIYLNARNEHINYWRSSDIEELHNAIHLYRRALEHDSTYGQAYAGLALAAWDDYYTATYFNVQKLDSILLLTRYALSFDENLEEAYFVRGMVYDRKDEVDKALNNLEKALQINPNYSLAYVAKADLYRENLFDFIKALQNYHKAVALDHGYSRPGILRALGYTYREIGFPDKADYYQREAFMLDNDSSSYLNYESYFKYYDSDLHSRLDIASERYERNPNHLSLDALIEANSRVGNYELAYQHALKQIELEHYQSLRIAYAFWKVGKREEAMEYFNRQISLSLDGIEMGNRYATEKWAHYDLAAVYAFLGDTGKAYQYLAKVKTRNFYPLWWRDQAKYDLLFESIRGTPQYQDLLQHMETCYQSEHERVRQWLEENEML